LALRVNNSTLYSLHVCVKMFPHDQQCARLTVSPLVLRISLILLSKAWVLLIALVVNSVLGRPFLFLFLFFFFFGLAGALPPFLAMGSSRCGFSYLRDVDDRMLRWYRDNRLMRICGEGTDENDESMNKFSGSGRKAKSVSPSMEIEVKSRAERKR
jgi:hypothetical protein